MATHQTFHPDIQDIYAPGQIKQLGYSTGYAGYDSLAYCLFDQVAPGDSYNELHGIIEEHDNVEDKTIALNEVFERHDIDMRVEKVDLTTLTREQLIHYLERLELVRLVKVEESA